MDKLKAMCIANRVLDSDQRKPLLVQYSLYFVTYLALTIATAYYLRAKEAHS